MSEREFASEEERWEALRGEGVEAAAPDGWEPGGARTAASRRSPMAYGILFKQCGSDHMTRGRSRAVDRIVVHFTATLASARNNAT